MSVIVTAVYFCCTDFRSRESERLLHRAVDRFQPAGRLNEPNAGGRFTLSCLLGYFMALCNMLSHSVISLSLLTALGRVCRLQTYEASSSAGRCYEDKLCAGDVVAAPFQGDWYRAFVEHVDVKTSRCHVIYVDYGNGDDVMTSEVRLLKQDLSQLPLQVGVERQQYFGELLNRTQHYVSGLARCHVHQQPAVLCCRRSAVSLV